MLLLQVLLTLLLALACMAWMGITFATLRSAPRAPRLADLDLPSPARWPRLSVVVPVRNERDRIATAVRTLRDQDYPNLEILMVDDRSTDDTAQVIQAASEGDPRVQVLRLGKLPDGWLGANHARHTGARVAKGEWIAFARADTHLERPDALRQAMRWALGSGHQHAALIPSLRARGFLAASAVAASLRTLFLALRPWSQGEQGDRAFFGSGALDLVARDALERGGGTAALHMDTHFGLALGHLVRSAGSSSGMAFATKLVSAAGHHSLREVADEMERRAYPLLGCNGPRIALVVTAMAVLELSPWISLFAFGIPALELLGWAAAACLLTTSVAVAVRARHMLLPALTAPLGAVLHLALLTRAAVLGTILGGVRWGDTIVRSDALRLGASLRLNYWSRDAVVAFLRERFTVKGTVGA